MLKNFTNAQRRIRNEWRRKKAAAVKKEDLDGMLEELQKAFMMMGGLDLQEE